MKRIFLFSAILLSALVTASAQSNLVQNKDYESFKAINVSDKFTVKLRHAPQYSVRITSDERISPYVQVYVKNGTLYLILDDKSYTPELKKELRQKGASEPFLEAEVYMPTVSSLILKDKSHLLQCDRFHAESFVLTASDNAKISQFNLDCATAELNFSKSCIASVDINASGKLYISSANSSEVSLAQNGGIMFLETTGSSVFKAKAAISEAEMNVSNGSNVTVSGTASAIKVKASGLSRTDLEQFEAKDGSIEQTGSSKCHVNVTDHLKVNLTGGSMLTFKRKPAIDVERIVASTLIKADDPKRK